MGGNVNDFFVAIQGIMTSLHEAGVSVENVTKLATEAVEEWGEEMEGEKDEAEW